MPSPVHTHPDIVTWEHALQSYFSPGRPIAPTKSCAPKTALCDADGYTMESPECYFRFTPTL